MLREIRHSFRLRKTLIDSQSGAESSRATIDLSPLLLSKSGTTSSAMASRVDDASDPGMGIEHDSASGISYERLIAKNGQLAVDFLFQGIHTDNGETASSLHGKHYF